MSPADTADPIVMPFGMWNRVGPRNHVLDGVPDAYAYKGVILRVKKGPAQDITAHVRRSID